MDRRPQLPPITTHFAEYFPKYKSPHALVTPPEDLQSPHRTLKRKRSDAGHGDEASPRPLEPTPASGRPGSSTYSSGASGESERKRLRPYIPRDPFQPRLGVETGESEHGRSRALTSPRHYVASEDRESQTSTREYAQDQPSYERSHRRDWLANVSGARDPASKALPPFSRPASPPRHRLSDDRWKGPWRSSVESHPSPVEPKTSYFQVPPDKKTESTFSERNATSEAGRIPPFASISSAGDGNRSQASDARHSPTSSRHGPLNPITSPESASPRSRALARPQTTPPQPSARAPAEAPVGFPASASDSSPLQPTTSPPRYTWDAPGLYDHPHRKRRGNLPKESTALLTEWFNQHSSYPYPKEAEKQALQAQTGLAMSQISNWFVNARRRRRPSASSRGLEHQHHHQHHHHHHQQHQHQQPQQPPSAHGREPLHTARYR